MPTFSAKTFDARRESRGMDVLDESRLTSSDDQALTLTDRALPLGFERRRDRRHDLAPRGVVVERWDGFRQAGTPLGRMVDLSAGGVQIEANTDDIRPGTHLRLRLRLPNVAGISPFVDTKSGMQPCNEWVGWMEVARVVDRGDGTSLLGGRLLDMEELDRGMLKLYLSIQPLAA